MERREFLSWVGTGAIASFLPVAIAACSPSQDSSASSTGTTESTATDSTAIANASTDDGRINMGKASDLDTNGYLYSAQDNVIVVKNEDGSLSALNSRCTHQQCAVEWDGAAANLSCPCHSSVFATDGSVISGPAPTPLPSYANVTEEGENIFVTVS